MSEAAAAAAPAKPGLPELTAASLRVGCLGFGGPAGQIALMHRVFVEEKRWIDEPRYLHALNYCMLLPGPEAQQLATYVGWMLRGTAGGVIAGALFVLPGAIVVFLLSWLYAAAGAEPLVEAAFFGVKAAVAALVAQALWKIGRRALKGSMDIAVAAISFALLFFWSTPFPLVVLGAGVVGWLTAHLRSEDASPPRNAEPFRKGASLSGAFGTAIAWLAAWLAPLAAAILALGPDHTLSRVGRLFSTLALTTFGGAYAALAYLRQEAVEGQGWLAAGEMIDGLGLAETTPGPLVLVNEYVGFIAGWRDGGLAMAALCAAMAAWCTFAPSFVWIFAGAPFAETLRANRGAQAALRGITAAVLGVIANLALWFAVHLAFARVGVARLPLGAASPAPDLATFNAPAVGLAVLAAVALFRLNVGVIALVLAAAACGMGLSMLGIA